VARADGTIRGSVHRRNLFQSGRGAARRGAPAFPFPHPGIRMASTQDTIRDFILTTFPGDGTEPAPDTDLLDAGIIDSIGVLTLVTWLEETFGFTVDDEDVVPENLGSIAGISAYVERKLTESGTA
jgi:acyl carrier protein